MLSDPRSIAFIVDCVHPQVRHEPASLQRLYSKLAAAEGGLGYANFNMTPVGAQMTTVHGPASIPGGTSHSALTFGVDRIQVKEEWPQITLDDFIDRARTAVETTMNELPIPMFGAIQCVIRCLVNAQGTSDSRQYFDDNFFRMDETSQEHLGRQANLLGLRLAFPAVEGDASVHNVRIESFNGDVRSIFLEECGVYQTPITVEDSSPIETAIRGAYDFLTQNVADYLRHPRNDG